MTQVGTGLASPLIPPVRILGRVRVPGCRSEGIGFRPSRGLRSIQRPELRHTESATDMGGLASALGLPIQLSMPCDPPARTGLELGLGPSLLLGRSMNGSLVAPRQAGKRRLACLGDRPSGSEGLERGLPERGLPMGAGTGIMDCTAQKSTCFGPKTKGLGCRELLPSEAGSA